MKPCPPPARPARNSRCPLPLIAQQKKPASLPIRIFSIPSSANSLQSLGYRNTDSFSCAVHRVMPPAQFPCNRIAICSLTTPFCAGAPHAPLSVLDFRIGAAHVRSIVNTQLPNNPQHQTGPERVKRVEVYWHAVTYKQLVAYALILVALIFGAAYLVTPGFYAAVLNKVTNAVGGTDPEPGPLATTQAKFVNLDGRVQVKKVNSVQWGKADYRTTLDKGDLIQTAGDGAARIAFADSTSSTIKADTLVTLEENNVTHDQA